MNTLIIADTHKRIEALQAKGASKELAEEIVTTVQQAQIKDEPATKSDIIGIDVKIESLRSEIYRGLVAHGLAVVGTIFLISQII